jgi:bacteriocin-like protein
MSKKKNLLSQATRFHKRITVQDMPVDLVELSKKDLQQIIGGRQPMTDGGCSNWSNGKGCGSVCHCRIKSS